MSDEEIVKASLGLPFRCPICGRRHDPEKKAWVRCVRKALASVQLYLEQIDYIKYQIYRIYFLKDVEEDVKEEMLNLTDCIKDVVGDDYLITLTSLNLPIRWVEPSQRLVTFLAKFDRTNEELKDLLEQIDAYLNKLKSG